MPPLQLTDAEMDVLTSLAAPIAFGRRAEFCKPSLPHWRAVRRPDQAKFTAPREPRPSPKRQPPRAATLGACQGAAKGPPG